MALQWTMNSDTGSLSMSTCVYTITYLLFACRDHLIHGAGDLLILHQGEKQGDELLAIWWRNCLQYFGHKVPEDMHMVIEKQKASFENISPDQ